MAGKTTKTEAICLRIHPWSQTSHVVQWLTPLGKIATVVKGAVRPKSAFLGQYDLNYTCDIVYYLRARNELHALRECVPVETRDALRGSLPSLIMADHFRALAGELAPTGEEAREWFELLAGSLDELAAAAAQGHDLDRAVLAAELVEFELSVLRLSGLFPEIEAESGVFALRGERKIPVSESVTRCLREPRSENNMQILLDTARVIGVFYDFHLDCPLNGRRAVLKSISQQKEKAT